MNTTPALPAIGDIITAVPIGQTRRQRIEVTHVISAEDGLIGGLLLSAKYPGDYRGRAVVDITRQEVTRMNPDAPEPTAQQRANALRSLEVRYVGTPAWNNDDAGYAIADRRGVLLEHHIPTAELAEERRRFHADRLARLRAWDDAHRTT